MLTIDDILPLIGTKLDESAIEHLFGERGWRFSNELDPDHAEDQRHYYGIRAFSLEMILGDGDVLRTIFFHLHGEQAGYPWALRNGLGRNSSRNAVLAAMGTPERSGKAEASDGKGCVWFDRFKVGPALLHFEYEEDCKSVQLITAMMMVAAP